MGFARRQGDRVVEGVGGFDADHALPLVVAEVGHRRRLGDPRVPDHQVGRTFVRDPQRPSPARVVEHHGRVAKVEPIRFGSDPDLAVLHTVQDRRTCGAVEVADSVEAVEADLPDITDGQVGVQGFLDSERIAVGVGDGEVNLQEVRVKVTRRSAL